MADVLALKFKTLDGIKNQYCMKENSKCSILTKFNL